MELTIQDLRNLPSPFYRVAVKVLIFDDQNKLLVVFNAHGEAEIPGGGWEHHESLEGCINRELREELGVGIASVSPILFTVADVTNHGWQALRLVVRGILDSTRFVLGDGMTDWKFVNRHEFIELRTANPADERFKDYADKIWQ